MLLSIHVFKGINTSPYPRRQTRLRKPNANDKAIATAKIPYSLRILLPWSPSEVSMLVGNLKYPPT